MKSIVLLLALMVSNVAFAYSDRARPYAAQADISGIKTSFDLFAVDCGRYPTTPEGFTALINCPTNISGGRWRGPYLDPAKIPRDPWFNEFVYRCPGIHNTNGYDLYSCGADGISKSGGSDQDDINNWDPDSPRGDFIKRFGESIIIAVGLLFVATLLFEVVLLVASTYSRRVRDFIAKHPTAYNIYKIWLVISSVGVLLFLLSSLFPRIS